VRGWRRADVPQIVAGCADPLIIRYIPVPIPYTEADAHAWLDSQPAPDGLSMAIADAADQRRVLGSIGVNRVRWEFGTGEIGYWVVPDARGRGVATRALRIVSRWALRRVGLERLELLAEPENVASNAVALRCGYAREGLLRRARPQRGERRDYVLYGLLREELLTEDTDRG
jgi:RimJ/RimL family protein N-acetyltransferase